MRDATGIRESTSEAVKHSLDPTTFYTWNAFERTKSGMGEGH